MQAKGAPCPHMQADGDGNEEGEMASALLRTSGRRASAFRRVVSAAAAPTAAPSGGEGLAVRRSMSLPPSPFRRLLGSAPQGDQPPKSLEEKVDQMQLQMKEFDEDFEKNLTEVLLWHKEQLKTAPPSYFERFMVKCGMPKGKYGDDTIWRCELATLFVLSTVIGYLLSYMKSRKHM